MRAAVREPGSWVVRWRARRGGGLDGVVEHLNTYGGCPLYTSDAADYAGLVDPADHELIKQSCTR